MASFKPYSTGAMLQNDLPEITGKLAEVVSDAIREQAEVIASEARSNAPEGETGNLKASIGVVEYNEPGAVGWRVEASATSDNRVRASSTNRRTGVKTLTGGLREGAPYPFYVELGTKFMDAQPFLFPALEQNTDNTLTAVHEALKDL